MCAALVALAVAGLLLAPPPALRAQDREGSSPPDSAEMVRRARDAQARFERIRRAHLPYARVVAAGRCEERVGRMCVWSDDPDDWTPPPEAPEVVAARAELLEVLEVVGEGIPGDSWVLGQRVRYLGEAERWEEAESLVRRCEVANPWLCPVLEGYVLHRTGRWLAAEEAFRRGLAAMPEEMAREWEDPSVLLDSRGRAWFREWGAVNRSQALERVWRLADPLFLVPGNDRRTEHFARRVHALLQEGARNPYGLRWGDDLAEVLVRYGWEVGWERIRPRMGDGPVSVGVIGHHAPGSRWLLPPGDVLSDVTSVPPGRWVPVERGGRSGYAPPYAPALSAGRAQLARFRRGDSALVVAAYELPPDMIAPPEDDEEVRAGLFLLDGETRIVARVERTGGARGVLVGRAPPGTFLLSLEVWSPRGRRAERIRRGISLPDLPRDVPSLSDPILVEGASRPPRSLEEALRRMLPRVEGSVEGVLTVAWEVYGLAGVSDPLRFSLGIQRARRGLLRRVGERLRLLRPRGEVRLTWTEPAPRKPGPLFRAVEVEVPGVEPGSYVLHLELRLPARSAAVVEREVTLR